MRSLIILNFHTQRDRDRERGWEGGRERWNEEEREKQRGEREEGGIDERGREERDSKSN